MNQRLVDEEFTRIKDNEWSLLKHAPFGYSCDDIWLYKTDESRILVRANQIENQRVTEWRADIQRVHSGFKIGAPLLHSNDLDTIKELCEKELSFVESISIPNRDLESLYQSEPIENPNRLSRVD